MVDLDHAIAAAREALADYDAKDWQGFAESAGMCAARLRDLLAALDAARGEAVAWVGDAGQVSDDDFSDGLDLEIRNPYRPSESWHIKAAAIGLKVSREAIDHTARLLELSDHHLTNGPYPIDRGKTYWRAQAAVAIGAVNELVAKTEQGKEIGNG